MKINYKTKIFFILILFFGIFGLAKSSFAADIYITQSASGNDTGTDCANAHSVTWFNTAVNWANPKTTGKIGPGDTVHLCGTFTFPANVIGLDIPGSGADGSPVTILFEPDAKFQSPQFSIGIRCHWYWGCQGNLIIDGGTNGVIENTANGTGLAYHADSIGVVVSGWSSLHATSNVEVKNLTIRNIYVNGGSNPTALDTDGGGTTGITLYDNLNNISVHNNIVSNSRTGIGGGFDGNTWDNIDIYNNKINDHCWGMTIAGLRVSSLATNVKIHNNEITDWTNWQCPAQARGCSPGWVDWSSASTYSLNDNVSYAGYYYRSLQGNNLNHTPGNTGDPGWWLQIPDAYHTDGIIAWSGNNPGTPVYAPLIYNNYIHGNLGSGSPTGFIFCTVGNPLPNSVPGSECIIFNNLLIGENGGSGRIWFGTNTENNQVYNNVFVGSSPNQSSTFNPCIISSSLGGDKYKNNICVNFSQVFATQWAGDPASYIAEMDNNIFWNFNTPDPNRIVFGNGYAYSIDQWRALGRDIHSVFTDPKFDSSYHLTSGSSAIGIGANLSAVGITQLNLDKMGNSRPSADAWDVGSYQYSGTPPSDTTPPAVPTGLTIR